MQVALSQFFLLTGSKFCSLGVVRKPPIAWWCYKKLVDLKIFFHAGKVSLEGTDSAGPVTMAITSLHGWSRTVVAPYRGIVSSRRHWTMPTASANLSGAALPVGVLFLKQQQQQQGQVSGVWSCSGEKNVGRAGHLLSWKLAFLLPRKKKVCFAIQREERGFFFVWVKHIIQAKWETLQKC